MRWTSRDGEAKERLTRLSTRTPARRKHLLKTSGLCPAGETQDDLAAQQGNVITQKKGEA